MADAVTVAAGSIVGRSQPLHHFFDEAEQYRCKLQTFSRMGAEVTVQRISFDRDQARYLSAYHAGRQHVPTRRVRVAPDPDAPRDAESVERCQRRAKTRVRLLVTELAPSALVTFTTRATITLDRLLDAWQRFNRLVTAAGLEWQYVAVPEYHADGRHLHLHVAMRGRTPIKLLRRLWHIALEAQEGRRITKTLRGADAPGNIDVEVVRGATVVKRVRKIARYISKYITKDLISAFNRRRYWPSKGIDLADAQVFWLSSTSQADAIREACGLLAIGGAGKAFIPSDRVAWWPLDPDPPAS